MDRLPPHSIEGEAAVLGCCLLAASCIAEAEERFRGEPVFYDIRHQVIWHALLQLKREGKGNDVIALRQRLKDAQSLDQVGGDAYLAELPNKVPGANSLPVYLDMVWEKFLARRLVQHATETVSEVFEHGGVSEALIGRIERRQEEFRAAAARGQVTPQYLKPASDFGDAYLAHFFGGAAEEPGAELPIPFPLRIRHGETTVVSGDDKAGKSTLLNFFAIHLAAQGEKVCVASMEMPPAVTLWILASQLLGAKHLPDSTEGHARAKAALTWLNQHFVFYDFLGIADWRDVLDTFSYAAGKGRLSIAILDSVMRIGIPDDDYSQQGTAAASFAQWAKQCQAHLFYVIHENKSDGKGKGRIRGSKLWTANADNVLRVERNLEKGEKVDKVLADLENEKNKKKRDEETIKELMEAVDAKRREWDSQLVLMGQRWPGSRQNASRRFWFDRESFQFRVHWEDPSVNWLEQWKPKIKDKV